MSACQAFTQAIMKTGEMPIKSAFELIREYPEYKDVEEVRWNREKPAMLMNLIREAQSAANEFGFSVDIVKNPLSDDGNDRCIVWYSKDDSTALQDTSGIDVERDLLVVKFMQEFINYLFEKQLIGGLDNKGVYALGDDMSMLMARLGMVNQTNTAISLLVEEQWLMPAHGNKFYCTMRFYQEFKGYLDLNRPQDEMNDRLSWAKSKAG
ncbi:hypothetical protein CJU89_0805 [Yarrowia sp. B02]|nr:hypothetical protein CJU89_0805 [Yarrowia sp. B02]